MEKERAGYWHIFRIEAENKEYNEQYMGNFFAFEGKDDFGDDIYRESYLQELTPHDDEIVLAEADGAADVIVEYRDGTVYHFIHNDTDLEDDSVLDSALDLQGCCRSLTRGDTGWQCWGDETGCLYNDGDNNCGHEGYSLNPLKEEEI